MEKKLLQCNKDKKRAYICSPLNAETENEILRNMHRARAYMYYAIERMDYIAKAPHAYLPMLLCDTIPAERALALRFGLKLLETCDVILVCGTHISKGMRAEIVHASSLHMPVITFHKETYLEVKEIIMHSNGDVCMVSMDRRNFPMSHSQPTAYLEWCCVPVSM